VWLQIVVVGRPDGCFFSSFVYFGAPRFFGGKLKVTKKIVMRKPGLKMSVGSTHSGRLVSLLVGNIDPVPVVIIASYLISKASITHPRIALGFVSLLLASLFKILPQFQKNHNKSHASHC
jgi:hypothetical protein